MKALRAIAPFACLLLAAFDCSPAPAPKVTMTFSSNLPVENNALPTGELGKFNINTTFSKSHNEVFVVEGLTVSTFWPEYRVTFDTKNDPITGNTCLFAKTVDLSVSYNPTVYIASEHRPGSCQYRQILLHEVRHVNTSLITFKEYLPVMQADVQAAADKLQVAGPLTEAEILPARDKTVKYLHDALAASTDRIAAVFRQRQQAIDTREEYLRTSRACLGERAGGGQ